MSGSNEPTLKAEPLTPADAGQLEAHLEALDHDAPFAGSRRWNAAGAAAERERSLVPVAFLGPGGNAIGLAVLARGRAGLRTGSPGARVLRWPGAPLGWAHRPLRDVRDAAAVAAGWLDALRRAFPTHRLELAHTCSSSVAFDAPLPEVGSVWRRPLRSSDDFWAGLEVRHRRSFGYYRRRIERSGAVFETVREPGAVLDQALADCAALHRARIARKGSRSAASAPAAQAFLRGLAAACAGAGVRIDVLRREGRPLAACLSVVHRGWLHALFSGWDPGEPRLDLGRQVILHQLLDELPRGLRGLDLGGGDLDYKREFGARPVPTTDVVCHPSPAAERRGQAVERVVSGVRKVRALWRRTAVGGAL